MKIGLLTIHHAYNFGAALQAYATYDTLKNMGYDVEFIDYGNDTFRAERNLFLPNSSVGNIIRNMRTLFALVLTQRTYEEVQNSNPQLVHPACRRGNYDAFVEQYKQVGFEKAARKTLRVRRYKNLLLRIMRTVGSKNGG